MKRSAVGVLFSGHHGSQRRDLALQQEEQSPICQEKHDSADGVLEPGLLGKDAGDQGCQLEGPAKDPGKNSPDRAKGDVGLLAAGLLGDGHPDKDKGCHKDDGGVIHSKFLLKLRVTCQLLKFIISQNDKNVKEVLV